MTPMQARALALGLLSRVELHSEYDILLAVAALDRTRYMNSDHHRPVIWELNSDRFFDALHRYPADDFYIVSVLKLCVGGSFLNWMPHIGRQRGYNLVMNARRAAIDQDDYSLIDPKKRFPQLFDPSGDIIPAAEWRL